jgi:hypothetical protein
MAAIINLYFGDSEIAIKNRQDKKDREHGKVDRFDCG